MTRAISHAEMQADTATAIMMLNAEKAPEYPDGPRSKPSDPTPLYWRTALALGYTPGRHEDEPTRLQKHILALEPTPYRVGIRPIPARPLSYRARSSDPDTSRSPAPPRALTAAVYHQILALFQIHKRLTDEQLLEKWGELHPPISPSGLRSRRAELVAAGRVVDSGERGRTVSGRPCIIWRLT